MGIREQGKNHGNLKLGDTGAEVLAGPPGSSSKDQAVERGGMDDFVKDSKCFFLWLFGVEAQYLGERFEVPIPQGGEAGRQSWQGIGSKKVEIMKGPLNALENVRRNAFKTVVSEAVESTEKACSNGLIIPARALMGLIRPLRTSKGP